MKDCSRPLICLVCLVTYSIAGRGAETALHIRAAEAAYRKALAAQAAGASSEAIGAFQSAIDIEPTYLDAYTQLAYLFDRSGRSLDAGRVLTMLLQIQPADSAARIRLGQILLEQGATQRALAQFSLALAHRPDDADALAGFVAAAEATGLRDNAVAALARGQREHPLDPRFRSGSRAPKLP